MDFLNKAIRSVSKYTGLMSKTAGDKNMNKKTILELNSTASVRPVACLALAMLAVGAFGNSAQAQWVNENFNLLVENVAPSVTSTLVSVGGVGGAGGGALRMYKTQTTSAVETKIALSPNFTTNRPAGYISYKIKQNQASGNGATGYLNFGLGANDSSSLGSSVNRFVEVRHLMASASNLKVGIGTNTIATTTLANITTAQVTVKIWYNNNSTSTTYIRPDNGASTLLSPNSVVVFVADTLVTPSANGTAIIANGGSSMTASSTIGKISFSYSSTQTGDFNLDDVYVADSAPASTSAPTLTTNPIPVTVQAGTTVTNTISYGGNPTPVFTNTGTWPAWATLSSNGVAVFSPSSSEAVATNSFTFTASNSVGATNGTFNVSVTAAALVAPVITSPSTVSGKLAWPYTSTTNNALYQITTDIAATGYSCSGTLPAGLLFDTANGRIYGTPTALATNTSVNLVATAGALSSTSSLSISIVASTWSGASANWNDTTAWTDGVVPQSSTSSTNGSVAIFGATTGAGADSVVVGDKSIYGLIFNSGANAYTFSALATGNALTVANLSGITNNSTTTQTFNTKVINIGGTGTWASTTTSGALVFNGGIDLSGSAVGRTVTLGGVGPITVAGTISDGTTALVAAGSLNIINTGLTTLNAASTYNGTTTVATGANLKLGDAAALGSTAGATTVSGTLDLFGFSPAAENFTLSGGSIVNSGSAASTINGTIGLTGTANSINTSNADINLSGVISGSLGSFAKNGANTLTLTGLNTFTGGLTLNAGTVIGNSDSPFGTYNSGTSINLLGGNLIVQNTNALGYGPTGAGGVRPRLNLGGGQLTAQVNLTLNANGASSGQVNIAAASTISVDSNTTVRIERMVATDNTIAANSVLTKTGPGTLSIIGSAATVIGGYRVNEGILAFNGSANAGMGSGPIVMNGGSLLVSKGIGSKSQYSGFNILNTLTLQMNTTNYFEPNVNSPQGYNVMSLGGLNLNGYKLTYKRTNTSAWVSDPQTDPSVTFRSAALNSDNNTLENDTSLVLVLQGASGTGGLTKTGTGELRLLDQPNQVGTSANYPATGTVTSISLPDAPMKGFTTTNPIVTIAPPLNLDGTEVVGGTRATATAIVSNGVITGFTNIIGGSGYVTAPQVTVTPDVAVTANTYSGPTLVQGGKLNLSGSSSSSLSFASGTTLELNYMAPAEATAAIDSDNTNNTAIWAVKSISLSKSVGGYTSAPTVTIGAPQNLDGSLIANGVAATATAQVANGRIIGFTITRPGSGYSLFQRPSVSITPPQEATPVATTTGSLNFAPGSRVRVTMSSTPTEGSYTLVTAEQGISGLPTLESLTVNGSTVSGYSLIKSSNNKNLLLASVDTVNPVITLIGASTLNVAYGSSYTDLGARVTDNKDAERSINGVGLVNTLLPGSYTIIFNATDAAGNIADTVTRTVVVGEAPDTTKPVITLIGDSTVNVAYGASYTDLGATVTDNKDAERPIIGTGSVNTSVSGSYTITFNAVDAAGNNADTVTRTVVVGAAPVSFASAFGGVSATAFGADGIPNLLRYAMGANNASASVVKPVSSLDANNLSITAVVRINDAKVTVVGESATSLSAWNTEPIAGVRAADQTGATAGETERQVFSVARGGSKTFLRLKAIQSN
jgi:autotransporter-associated beta strand protein